MPSLSLTVPSLSHCALSLSLCLFGATFGFGHLPFNLTLTQSHTHTHSLSLVLVVMLKSKELKTKISHAQSLILSHSHCALSLTVFVLSGTAQAEYPWLQHGDSSVKTVLTITFRVGSIAAEAEQINAATVRDKLSGDSVSNACVKSQSCYDDYDLEALPPAPIDKPSDSNAFWPWILLIVCILAGFGLCYYYTWRRKAAEQKVQGARDSSTARLMDAAAQDQAELVHQPAQQANPPEADGSSQPLKEQSASPAADDALDINAAVSKEESDCFFDLYDTDGSGSVDMEELLEMVAAFKQRESSSLNRAKIKEVWDADGDGMVSLLAAM